MGAARGDTDTALGVRVLRDTPTATAVCVALHGSDASLAEDRYRITGIESQCASTGQVTTVLKATK